MFRILALVIVVSVLAWVLLRRRVGAPASQTTTVSPGGDVDPTSPSEGASPAVLRLASGMPYDAIAVTADLIDMAARGWLRISREPRLVGFRWRLVRLAEADSIALHPAQAALAAGLYVREGSEVELSEASARRLAAGIDAHLEALRDKRAARGRVDRKVLLTAMQTRLAAPGDGFDFDAFTKAYGYAAALGAAPHWVQQLRAAVPDDVIRRRLANLGWYHGSGAQMLDDPAQLNQALVEQLVAHIDQLAKPSGLLAPLGG